MKIVRDKSTASTAYLFGGITLNIFRHTGDVVKTIKGDRSIYDLHNVWIARKEAARVLKSERNDLQRQKMIEKVLAH